MINGWNSKTDNIQESSSSHKLPLSQTTTALKNSSTTSQSNNQRSSTTSSSLKPQQDTSSSNEINPDDICSPHELIGWVDNVLEKLETKFSGVEAEVLQRLDALGKRIDSLELSMSSLLDGASSSTPIPNQPSEGSTTSPAKPS